MAAAGLFERCLLNSAGRYVLSVTKSWGRCEVTDIGYKSFETNDKSDGSLEITDRSDGVLRREKYSSARARTSFYLVTVSNMQLTEWHSFLQYPWNSALLFISSVIKNSKWNNIMLTFTKRCQSNSKRILRATLNEQNFKFQKKSYN